jgi:AraC family transcriptional regulator of arabinose operon
MIWVIQLEQNSLNYLQDILHQLQIDVLTAAYTQCSTEWSDFDYIPEYNKFYYIRGGEGRLTIDSENYYPQAGQLCLMPAKVVQSYTTISPYPFRKYWCHFTARIGQFDLFELIDVPFCLDVIDQEQLSRQFEELISLHTTRSLSARIREKAIILELIASYLEQVSDKTAASTSFNFERPIKIRRYIEEHLHQALTVEALAHAFYLHPNYFIKYFKKHFGVSPLRYINRKRMETAKYLLKTTNLSIKEIAERIGFEELNYFSRAFKKETSLSPSEFRGI